MASIAPPLFTDCRIMQFVSEFHKFTWQASAPSHICLQPLSQCWWLAHPALTGASGSRVGERLQRRCCCWGMPTSKEPLICGRLPPCHWKVVPSWPSTPHLKQVLQVWLQQTLLCHCTTRTSDPGTVSQNTSLRPNNLKGLIILKCTN